MDIGDEISRRGLLLAIVAVVASTAGAIIALDRYTVLGFVRAYSSGMFAMLMVWSYGLDHHWSDPSMVFYTGTACVFADYVLVGVLKLAQAFSRDPLSFVDKWRGKP